MKPDVFVSYSSQDFSRVMPLVNRLRSTGISVWVDEGNIDAATLWSESIVDAIAECTVLIMMVSLHSTNSHNVVKEVMIASESKKTILPIYLESAEIPSKLKYQLTGIQHLEWFNGGSDDIFEILKDSLFKIGVNVSSKILSESKSRIIELKTQRDEKRTFGMEWVGKQFHELWTSGNRPAESKLELLVASGQRKKCHGQIYE